jgi:hypothetical protein
VNEARYFMRRDEYQPAQTPVDSPFRCFNVSCVKCGSFQVKAVAEFDESAGVTALILLCKKCGGRERIKT